MTTDPQPDRYRQRPNECDAIQWTGDNADALSAFAGIDFAPIDPADRIDDPDCDAQLLVEASHWVGIRPGDWVLKFEGYFVAKDDAPFRAVWEPAAVPSAPADQAAILLDAATSAERLPIDQRYVHHGQLCDAWDDGRDAVVRLLRRLAAEAHDTGTQQPECTASISGNCLNLVEGFGPCDIDEGECIHGGQPPREQPDTETRTSWTPGPVALARAAEWATKRQDVTPPAVPVQPAADGSGEETRS